MNNGYIKLYRKIKEKGWYKNSKYVHLWIHLLLLATHKVHEFMWNNQIIVIKEGQILTGRKQLSDETGLAQSTIEKILKLFEKEHQIEQQKTTKFRIITIINWKEYQQREQQKEQQSDNRVTTKEQQSDTYKNDKKVKNDKNNPAVAIAPAVDNFNLEEEINKLQSNKREDLRIIGWYLEMKWRSCGYNLTNKQQLSSFIKRNLRSAKLLLGYSSEQFLKTSELLAKKANYSWTLETISKFIDNPAEIKPIN